MVEPKEGLIVNIGSIAGNIPTPWNGIYCASKAAVHALSDTLAMECKPFGVKVILVVPGAVQSNISTKQAATLKLYPTSIYKPYFDRVYEHLYFGRGNGCMPTDEFARRVVAKVLSPNPPNLYVTWRQLTSCRVLPLAPSLALPLDYGIENGVEEYLSYLTS
ncbi:NAD(P)-binding protein [Suillus decipiens]|nr:NAD(P)-binding protein [Suillus decipiens]